MAFSSRSLTSAQTSWLSSSFVAIRRSKHCFDSAENSISIMFSQLADFGV
jgi:hypothetical protein